MKNTSSIGQTLTLSVALGITACAAAQKPQPQACDIPKPAASASSKPLESPAPNTALAHPTKPTNNSEFFANVLSCEATANANAGYLQSIGKRLDSSAVSPSDLPCNVIVDIRDNLQRTMEHCTVVVEPQGLYLEMDPNLKLARRKLAEQAAEITAASREAIEMIQKKEKRCFGGDTSIFNHSVLL